MTPIRLLVATCLIAWGVVGLQLFGGVGGCVSQTPRIQQGISTTGPSSVVQAPSATGSIQSTKTYAGGDPWPFRIFAAGFALLPIAGVLGYGAYKLWQSSPIGKALLK